MVDTFAACLAAMATTANGRGTGGTGPTALAVEGEGQRPGRKLRECPVVGYLDMYPTNVLMYRTMVLLAHLTKKVRR